jgi:hypothetical protein
MKGSRHLAGVWDDVVWPAASGIVMATATWITVLDLGPAFVIGLFLLVAVGATPVAVELAGARGRSWRRSILVGVPLTALTVDVGIGLTVTFGIWGLAVMVLGTVTSPIVRPVLLELVRQAVETARARRAFGRIVSGEFPGSATSDDASRRPTQ